MREQKLPSGALLDIKKIPFSEAKALYQAVVEELKAVKIDTNAEMENLFKDIFCISVASKKVDDRLKVCMERCLYDGLKITDSTFEDEKARLDYSVVCFEVMQEAIGPFLKGLYAESNRLIAMILSVRK